MQTESLLLPPEFRPDGDPKIDLGKSREKVIATQEVVEVSPTVIKRMSF